MDRNRSREPIVETATAARKAGEELEEAAEVLRLSGNWERQVLAWDGQELARMPKCDQYAPEFFGYREILQATG